MRCRQSECDDVEMSRSSANEYNSAAAFRNGGADPRYMSIHGGSPTFDAPCERYVSTSFM